MNDPRPWIKLDQAFPENRKVMPLSDGAFRLYVTTLCWSARNGTDGQVPAGVMRALGRPALTRELVAAGLLLSGDEGFAIHDYLDHQTGASDISAARRARRGDGTRGAHLRHHVRGKKPNRECAHCLAEGLILSA